MHGVAFASDPAQALDRLLLPREIPPLAGPTHAELELPAIHDVDAERARANQPDEAAPESVLRSDRFGRGRFRAQQGSRDPAIPELPDDTVQHEVVDVYGGEENPSQACIEGNRPEEIGHEEQGRQHREAHSRRAASFPGRSTSSCPRSCRA